MRYGGIEAGGTKFVLGIGQGPDRIEHRTEIPTLGPAETLAAALDWLKGRGEIAALGIASFGPVDLDPVSPTWGYITNTTKPGWSHTNLARAFGAALGVRIGFDTDVNGAAIAEAKWGAAEGCASSVYLTVGTGIGGGAVVNGQALHGAGHPEMGHIRVVRHPDDRDFAGICAFHGDCCEGLASGPAILARYGASLSALLGDHPAHEMIAWYLAQLTHNVQAVLAPERIVMGGGVMKTPGLLDRVRAAATSMANGYFEQSPQHIIVGPGLGDNAGLTGAFALAAHAAREPQ